MKLSDLHELLYRQVHPSFIEDGVPSSAAFKPTPKDEGKLSLDRSSMTDEKASYELHTEGKKLASAGVYGLLVGECLESDLSCYSDPLPATEVLPANHAHAFCDFTQVGPSRHKILAKRLKNHAVLRGRLFPSA